MRDERAQGADVAGPGDLYNIGFEAANHWLQLAKMSEEQQIVLVSLVNREFRRAPPQLHVGNRTCGHNLVARARVNY